MTNEDKSFVARMVRAGASDALILKYVKCSKKTIDKYRMALETKGQVKYGTLRNCNNASEAEELQAENAKLKQKCSADADERIRRDAIVMDLNMVLNGNRTVRSPLVVLVAQIARELPAMRAENAKLKQELATLGSAQKDASPDDKEIVLALANDGYDALYIGGMLAVSAHDLHAAEVLPALSNRGLVTFRDLNIKLPEGEDFPTSLADAEKMKTE